MPRLFVTPRELNFISDITKELIKDINGQKIYYYPVSEIKTQAHEVYDEAIEKIFDNPIAIDALVSAEFHESTSINAFGIDQKYQIEVYVQYRDMVDKGIEINVGDYFSFSDIFYEITNATYIKNIYGQAEHRVGIKIVGTKVRDSQFKAKLLGPTDIRYNDADAVQTTFVQQRGLAENSEGLTGDKRDVIENEPLDGQREVSPRGAVSDGTNYESSFYDE